MLGCQDQVIAEDQIEFDVLQPEVAVTVKVPEGKSLVLVCSAGPSVCSSHSCLGWLFCVSVWLMTIILQRIKVIFIEKCLKFTATFYKKKKKACDS